MVNLQVYRVKKLFILKKQNIYVCNIAEDKNIFIDIFIKMLYTSRYVI